MIVDALGIDYAANYAQSSFCPGNWIYYLKESEDRNAGYYAVGMVWENIYYERTSL